MKSKEKTTNKNFEEINQRLTCMCLDVQGYGNIKNAAKKTFFEKSCNEYAKYKDPATSFDDPNGDASGVKAARLLVEETKSLTAFNAALAVDNTTAYTELAKVRDWVATNANKWGTGERIEDLLYKYETVKAWWFLDWLPTARPWIVAYIRESVRSKWI